MGYLFCVYGLENFVNILLVKIGYGVNGDRWGFIFIYGEVGIGKSFDFYFIMFVFLVFEIDVMWWFVFYFIFLVIDNDVDWRFGLC